jgi:hypothetical protein
MLQTMLTGSGDSGRLSLVIRVAFGLIHGIVALSVVTHRGILRATQGFSCSLRPDYLALGFDGLTSSRPADHEQPSEDSSEHVKASPILDAKRNAMSSSSTKRRLISSRMESKASPEQAVREQVTTDRPQEIEQYLRLFGYKPERTILQVHIACSFGHGAPGRIQVVRRTEAAARYQGHTFTVVGRIHDPALIEHLVQPRKTHDRNPGYMGYLFVGKDEGGRPPHELLPLDFIPNGMVYPGDWKSLFNTKGYLVTMHVPSAFASYKNELLRRLRRIGGAIDAKAK